MFPCCIDFLCRGSAGSFLVPLIKLLINYQKLLELLWDVDRPVGNLDVADEENENHLKNAKGGQFTADNL